MLVESVIANKINLSHCLSKFDLITLAQLEKIILHLKPTTSLHDILPSRLFKDMVDTIGPNIILIINSSLFHGIVPLEFKHAVIELETYRTRIKSKYYENKVVILRE